MKLDNSIHTAEGLRTSEVGADNLYQVLQDLEGNTELVGYQLNQQKDTITVILDLTDLEKDSKYIH